FGKLVSTAARVHAGQRVFTVSVQPHQFMHAKEALRRAGYKLPTPVSIMVDNGQELVQ
ncbi:MAG: ribosomal protein L16, partial [Methanosarcinales archaeon]|nr:ribosomal protein L16 [Methanosarcinales archaeon]